MPPSPPRALAIYLPQFHPIPENDAWWGKGFTEWTNAVRARPRFRDHQQPHLPADLSFYDLRLPEVRRAQADLARDHGVEGFCYYHYWFEGRRLLERPFEEVLASAEPEFPFCLLWANENWRHPESRKVLLEQTYSDEDDRRHMRWLAAAFRDPRHVRVDGRPLFLVYRAGGLPDPRRTVETWRTIAEEEGVGPIHLCRVESRPDERTDPASIGFDSAMDFQPDWGNLGLPLRSRWPWRWARRFGLRDPYGRDAIFDYATVVARMLDRPPVDYRRFPGVTPGWDNAARVSRGATILRDAGPDVYREWLEAVIDRRREGEDLVFINAWNEWAEGNHLEPCQRWGTAYLEATRRALGR